MDENADKSGLFGRVKEGFRNIRPVFEIGEDSNGAQDGPQAEKRANARTTANGTAADRLKGVEDSAGGELSQRGDSLEEARAGEWAGGFYSGGEERSGLASKVGAAKDFKKGNFKGAFKKAGPVLGIFFVIFGVGALMMGAQGSQLFSLVANLQENYNSMHTSAYIRSARFMRWQMDSGLLKNPVRGKGTAFSPQRFVVSEKQQTELARQGITYNDAYETPDGRKIRVFEYTTDGGQSRVVTADADTAASLRGQGVGALSFDAALNNATFSHKYTAGSMTWRGQFANWFGGVTNSWVKNNNLTRNMTKDFKQKKAEADGDGTRVTRELLDERTNTVDFGEEGKVKRSDLSQSEVETKLKNIAGKFNKGNLVELPVNASCAFVEIMGAFSGLVYAAQALQIMNIATLTFETVDKTKAGYGAEAPFKELSAMFNEKGANTNATLSAGTGGNVENLKLDSTYTTTTKAAMESEGLSSLFTGKKANPNNPSLKSFNLAGSIRSVMGGIGGDMNTFKGCSFAMVGAAVAGVVTTAPTLAACVAFGVETFGAACIPLLLEAGFSMLSGAAIAAGIGTLVAVLAPMITDVLVRDLTGVGGEDLGNGLWVAANMYQGGVSRANGGSYASIDSYKSFAVARQQVIAEEAKYERETMSQFDITSKNTFMGSIMAKLASFGTASSVMSTVSAGSSAVSTSLVGLMPSVSATTKQVADNLLTGEEAEEVCPYVTSVGAACDSGGTPLADSDLSTMDEEPGEVINILDDLGMFSGETSDGNVIIDKNSDLAVYVRYCPGRTSMLGTPDINIKNDIISGTSTGNDFVDGAIGSAPLVGEVLTFGEADMIQANFGYIGGQSCVNQGGSSAALAYAGDGDIKLTSSVGGTAASGDNWNLAKYYQRFIEDQSLAESMGLIEKSAVAVYLEEYYEENPLDNSYEGMLARYSGLDKETVSDMLDIIAYYNYINEYDASERYAFGAPVVDEGERVVNLENEYVMDGMNVALEGVVYADVRNQNFAV